ncbi:hypothetical protein A0O34_15155 [Chryseobacterium glaciei]|uniref:Uncharacterized protein n=1 Tax=Chryseobacterium glaciei TaxID=1685010 RepID=A0A172XXV0_9FLAO|nr:hypothetical protein [Chryseobacterium glaciei]ANF51761.1 hypothetical protein A0O34_15155 [Chryseobacterium glaciei]
MKRTIKLFYEPASQQFFVFYLANGIEMLFKVDQANPTMISRVTEHGFFKSKHERDKVIEEMEIFAQQEIRKLEDGM